MQAKAAGKIGRGRICSLDARHCGKPQCPVAVTAISEYRPFADSMGQQVGASAVVEVVANTSVLQERWGSSIMYQLHTCMAALTWIVNAAACPAAWLVGGLCHFV